MNKELIKPAIMVASGLVAGGLVGYMIGNKRAQVKYRAIADAEVAEVKEHYKLLRKEGEYATPEDLAKARNLVDEGYAVHAEAEAQILGSEQTKKQRAEHGRQYVEHIINNGYSGSDEPKEPSTPVIRIEEEHTTVSVFERPEPNSVELEERDTDYPYVISVDEFMNNDDFEKISITYFEFDNTLIDEREQIIPDVEGTISSKSLQRFGHGSKDEEIVYVRNERLHTDFEVARDERSYSEVVMGVAHWHSQDVKEPKPRVKKMRDDD